MNDCAWCGTGNGICEDCMNKLFAQSAALAASGEHLANRRSPHQSQETEREPEIAPENERQHHQRK